MCGLFGSTLPAALQPPDLYAYRRARDTLRHRGPDHQDDWHDASVYLGHTRLSILDTSPAGHQPMVSEGLVVTVNGEVYNYRALRDELADRCSFRSDSDSEVLLHGYRAWGLDGLLERLQGMYAFALYDRDARQLHLARDRVGIKPLYLWADGKQVSWASELKALTALDQCLPARAARLQPDPRAFYDFLTYRYVPAPRSMYRQVEKLEPGCCATVDLATGHLHRRRYWRLPEIDPGAQTSSRALEGLLGRAVACHLQADVPVGCFLSGGLDSSTVVSFAAPAHRDLQTFSLGFGGARSELPLARAVAARYQTRHQEAELALTPATTAFAQLGRWFDEPFADTSAFPLDAVSKLAADQVKVVLTGDGGDELFAGYPRYEDPRLQPLTARSRPGARWAAQLASEWPALRRPLRGLGRFALLRGFDYYARVMGGLTGAEKWRYRALWEIPEDYDDYWHYREHYDPALDPASALRRLEFQTYLPDDLLVKVDRVTMAHGLEARVPLLDQALIEAVLASPVSVVGSGKAWLRQTVGHRLPPALLSAPKQGFSIPKALWAGRLFHERSSRQEQILAQSFAQLAPLS